MRQLIPLTFALALSVTPAVAQEDPEGFDLMEEGARLLLRGLMQEMEPGLQELEGLMQQLGPELEGFAVEIAGALARVIDLADDIRHYEAPVILENGDIIMRRRADAPPYVPRGAAEGEPAPEIDL